MKRRRRDASVDEPLSSGDRNPTPQVQGQGQLEWKRQAKGEEATTVLEKFAKKDPAVPKDPGLAEVELSGVATWGTQWC